MRIKAKINSVTVVNGNRIMVSIASIEPIVNIQYVAYMILVQLCCSLLSFLNMVNIPLIAVINTIINKFYGEKSLNDRA
jgi:hypothetical protein